MTNNSDSSLWDQQQLYRQLKVKYRREAARCPKCGNRSYVRADDKTCLGCRLREVKK